MDHWCEVTKVYRKAESDKLSAFFRSQFMYKYELEVGDIVYINRQKFS